jgi:hypothetical protein
MKSWRPHIDLERLTAALGEDILAATDEEIRRAYAAAGRSVAGAAGDVKEQIAVADDDKDLPDPNLMPVGALRSALARQH